MKYCLLLFAGLLIISSCTKTEEPQSKEDILRDGKWYMSQIWKKKRVDTTYITDTVKLENYPKCREDDYLDFGDNNNGILFSGEQKCSNSLDEVNFRWGISDNDTKMYIYNAGPMFEGYNDLSGKLKDFTSNSFKVEYLVFNTREDKDLYGHKIFVNDTNWFTAIIKKF